VRIIRDRQIRVIIIGYVYNIIINSTIDNQRENSTNADWCVEHRFLPFAKRQKR